MSSALLRLDRETAEHLALAIKVHRRLLGRHEIACPPGLPDIEHWAIEVARGNTGANGGEEGEGAQTPTYVDRDANELLTQRQAAHELGRHPRTIRSYLDNGELGFVTVRGRRQIPRHELDRFTTGDQ